MIYKFKKHFSNCKFYYLDDENWIALDLRGREVPVLYDADLQIIEVRGQGGEFIYFIAPGK